MTSADEFAGPLLEHLSRAINNPPPGADSLYCVRAVGCQSRSKRGVGSRYLIGHSSDPLRRFKRMRAFSPVPLDLVLVARGFGHLASLIRSSPASRPVHGKWIDANSAAEALIRWLARAIHNARRK